MNDIAIPSPSLPAMSPEDIDKVRRFESHLLTFDQVEVVTRHLFHAGMYARTVCLPARSFVTGALIKIPTTLIVSGHVTVFVGDESIDLHGYHVLPGSAGRKQAFAAHAETFLTMIFPTSARTVDEAETEFTDETELLVSRQQSGNLTLNTGE